MKFCSALVLTAMLAAAPAVFAQAAPPAAAASANLNAAAPDELIRSVSNDVLAQIKGDKAIQAGDISKIAALVDQKIMPYVDFQRMTASAVGRSWRSATPAQQSKSLSIGWRN